MERRSASVAVALLVMMAGSAGGQEPVWLAGRVVAAGAGDPVVGAEVRLADGRSAVTDAEGRWRIGPVEPGPQELTVRHMAYAEATLRLASAAGPHVVRLTPRPVSLGELVVTASRRVQELKDVPVATEVVGRTELRATGASDLAAVLVERTGVALEGGHPVGAGVMLQGLGSERVLVLLDGQPYVGRLSGRQDLSRIPTASIERIEIVKGPQSTLYGSDAMGGVVNVITRGPAGSGWSGGFEATGGSRDRLDLAADVRGRLGSIGLSAEAGRRSIELVPGTAETAGTLAGRRDALAKLEWTAGPSTSVAAAGFALDERQRWRSGQLYNFADNRQLGGRLAAQLVAAAHRVAPTLYWTEFRHLSRQSTASRPMEGSGESESQRLAEAELLYGFTAGFVGLDAGIEARRESIRSDRVAGERRELNELESFAQVTMSGQAWSLVPGVRLSGSERWGTHWSPRLAALFRPVPDLALRTSVGRGYRAPDFKELYMEFLNTGPGFGYVVRGNPELRAETSSNVSASIEWAGQRVYARAQAYLNRFDDFIETRQLGDSSGVTVFTYGNVDDGTTRGVELETGATWGGLRVEAGIGFLDAEHADTGEPLLGRPARTGRLLVAWALPSGFRASATAVHTGPTPLRFQGDALIERAGFSRLDLRFAQELPHGLELTFGSDNVTGVRPAEWPGYLGRQFHLGVSWRGRTASFEAGDPFSRE